MSGRIKLLVVGARPQLVKLQCSKAIDKAEFEKHYCTQVNIMMKLCHPQYFSMFKKPNFLNSGKKMRYL